MSIEQQQIPLSFANIIQAEIETYQSGRTVIEVEEIPDTTQIPIDNQSEWLQINGVICVFVDMIGSTKLSATKYTKSTAGIYQLFTNTAIKIFDELDAPYIDVKGDGVFIMFNSNQAYKALVGAITFRTFVENEFIGRIKSIIDTGCHIGIDQKTVLVKKLGLKRKNGRSDRQNEVWAGRPVNMAAKLASLSKNSVMVSDRFFAKLKDDKTTKSCCSEDFWGDPREIWEKIDVSSKGYFDFEYAYETKSIWCQKHGIETAQHLLSL